MKTSKLLIAFALLITSSAYASAQNSAQMKTYKFAQRDTCELFMDVYTPNNAPKINKTIIYVFGGGFVQGSRTAPDNIQFYDSMLTRGYTVIAIDYRLGLKGVRKVGAFNPKPPFVAVKIAVEDLVSATQYIIENNELLGVDTSKIILAGSSAGAITVLQTDYLLANRHPLVKPIETFRYAGVISFAGAIFSTKGKPKYATPPAPTLLFHGTADKVVNYKQIRILNIGTFGSSPIIDAFNRQGYPYMAYRFEGSSHEVAEFPRHYCLDQIDYFLQTLVYDHKQMQWDVMIRDRYVLDNFHINISSLKDLYNKQ